MAGIVISAVCPGTPEIAVCAQWRIEGFADVIGANVEAERKSLDGFTADRTNQVALIARRDGVPAGTCLLVPSEIEPLHSVTPWLAGLYVTPVHRSFGVGRALVRAIEVEARERGHPRIYLYTDNAIGFCEPLGWRVTDRVEWLGIQTALMARDL